MGPIIIPDAVLYCVLHCLEPTMPRSLLSVCLWHTFLVTCAAEPAQLVLRSPRPYQVLQREGFQPKQSAANNPGGPELGFTDVTIEGDNPRGFTGQWQYRIVRLKNGYGQNTDWQYLQVENATKEIRGLAEVPAGGWYRLEVQCLDGQATVATGSVEPIGVGEVFLIAGQSYAGGYHDEILKVTDSSQAVSAYDWQEKTWRIAHDPPPHNGDGGSIWPHLGDMLVPTLRVPVAFVNVSVGDTSASQWLPNEMLHQRLVEVGKEIGLFRAVLWQQGESDVLEKSSSAAYVKKMLEIREAACDDWRFDPPWLLAKSTLHPTIYNRPLEENQIRSAIDQLWSRPGFRPGPDTDVLGGDNRGGANSRHHFSAEGQRRAAWLWFASLWNELNRDPDTRAGS
jgi:hypothetical protein